jgi:hypothetical protein
VTDNDSASCDPQILLFESGAVPEGLTVFVAPPAGSVTPGQTLHIAASVTASTDASPGTTSVPFQLLVAGGGAPAAGSLPFALLPPEPCFVRPNRELLVTDLSVVEDPVRTSWTGAGGDPRTAAWTFGRLMEKLAPTEGLAPAFVEAFFDTWLSDQTVNGFTVEARPQIDNFLFRRWPRRADGSLDLTLAPLRLLAIVNRIDLRSVANGHAGQGRFVFGVVDPAGFGTPFTVIVEYRLPARTFGDALAWARAWHELGQLPFPSEAFNARLQSLTDRFTARGADPRRVNGSALAAVRTDEVVLTAPWELREFELSPADGMLRLVPVDATPDIGFLGSPVLADFVNQRERPILAGNFSVPLDFEDAPFQGGSAPNELVPWTAPGIRSPRVRRAFSVGTCSGCHSIPETGTEFVHVRPRDPGNESRLSAFLVGGAVPDPVDGELEVFDDLGRRKLDLEGLVCRGRTDEGCSTVGCDRGRH